MRPYIALIVVVSILSCTANTKTATNQLTTGKDFYMRLEGTIGDGAVEMHVQNHDGRFNGLYFSADGITHNLWEEEGKNDTVYFAVSTPGANWTEGIFVPDTLKLYFNGSDYVGKLHRSDASTLPVKLKETYDKNAQKLNVISFADSVKAFSDSASPRAEIMYSFLESPDNPWINQTIKRIMETDSSLSFKDGFRKVANEYFANYKNESASIKADDDDGLPLATLNYSEIKDCNVQFNSNGLLIVDYTFYTYTGGAHGMYGNVYYCLDVDEQKLLRLQDVLQIDSSKMETILEKNFRAQYNIGTQPLSSVLFEDKISMTHNFYLNAKGIGFVYNPYDIAAYAMGPVNIFVPFSDIKPYLTQAIKTKLKIQ